MAVQYNSGALPPCLAFIWPSQLPADIYGGQDTMSRQQLAGSWVSVLQGWSDEELGELFVSWQTLADWQTLGLVRGGESW